MRAPTFSCQQVQHTNTKKKGNRKPLKEKPNDDADICIPSLSSARV